MQHEYLKLSEVFTFRKRHFTWKSAENITVSGVLLMKIQESAEDYLEAILYLSERMDNVRSIDVVHHLGLSKPSVSVYLKNLRVNGYLNMDDKGYITLTESGLAIASKIYERHKVLSQMFIALGVNEETAYKDACRIEHDLSDETFDALKNHYLNEIAGN